MECMSNMSQSLGLKKRSNRRPQGGVAATTKNMEAKRPALPKERGPRNTRKDAKGDERCGLGGPCHMARPDIGRGSGRVTAIAHRNPPTPPDMPFSASGG